MSESDFPFEGPTAAMAPELDVETRNDNRTKQLALVGGAAAALVVGVLGYFLFFSGGSDPAATDAAATPVPAATVPASTPTPSADTVTVQHINAKSFGRDPFKALIVDTSADSAATSATTDTTTGTTSTVPTGTTSTDTATSGGTTDTATTGGTTTPTVTTTHRFRVVGVSANGKLVTVRVDGKSYSGLKAGDVFATYFKVVVVGGKVNGFQFGDEKFSVFGTKKLYIAA